MVIVTSEKNPEGSDSSPAMLNSSVVRAFTHDVKQAVSIALPNQWGSNSGTSHLIVYPSSPSCLLFSSCLLDAPYSKQPVGERFIHHPHPGALIPLDKCLYLQFCWLIKCVISFLPVEIASKGSLLTIFLNFPI